MIRWENRWLLDQVRESSFKLEYQVSAHADEFGGLQCRNLPAGRVALRMHRGQWRQSIQLLEISKALHKSQSTSSAKVIKDIHAELIKLDEGESLHLDSQLLAA